MSASIGRENCLPDNLVLSSAAFMPLYELSTEFMAYVAKVIIF